MKDLQKEIEELHKRISMNRRLVSQPKIFTITRSDYEVGMEVGLLEVDEDTRQLSDNVRSQEWLNGFVQGYKDRLSLNYW
jgi:hypothetical protein